MERRWPREEENWVSSDAFADWFGQATDGFMVLAIAWGWQGICAAAFLTVLGGYGVAHVLGWQMGISLPMLFGVMILLAVLGGFCVMGNRRATILLPLNYWPDPGEGVSGAAASYPCQTGGEGQGRPDFCHHLRH